MNNIPEIEAWVSKDKLKQQGLLKYYKFQVNSFIVYLQKFQAKSLLLLFIAGAIGAVADAPLYIFPALIISLYIFFTFILHSDKFSNFLIGSYIFLFGRYLFSLYWITPAFSFSLGTSGWFLGFLVVILLSLILASINLSITFISYFISKPKTIFRIISFVMIFALSEWLRNFTLSGFPWSLMGYGWLEVEVLANSLAYLGIFGLSLIVILTYSNLIIAFLFKKIKYLFFAFAFLTFAAVLGFINLDYNVIEKEIAYDENPSLIRIIQPNIPQEEKMDISNFQKTFNTLVSLTTAKSKLDQDIDLVIWPETAIPFSVSQSNQSPEVFFSNIQKIMGNKSFLAIGIPDTSINTAGETEIYNSLYIIDKNGQTVEKYDKSHLVPFGEYVPLKKYFPFLGSLISYDFFSKGTGPRTLNVIGLPSIAVTICYESIFSSQIINKNQAKPQLLINVSNDAWYYNTSGPWQHMYMLKARSIEEGVPSFRSSNTGVSTAFTARGTQLAKLGLGISKPGIIDLFLPAISPKQTLFYKFGNKIFLILILAITCAYLAGNYSKFSWPLAKKAKK